ncbi:MAG: hypothetical protein Unbinned4512contig1001_12 [Prokaryotic dsDNA virus sp.]|nr:MAG: hypothetical protein Unbinned4512contig1001_12 [Prokaryotic dsDNA virus sp.]|tara:strand:+ start:2253 stop:2504 length:252 start_codon:yes stop_codon:yes gene_type:complete
MIDLLLLQYKINKQEKTKMKKWVAISYCYGDYIIRGDFNTKKEAVAEIHFWHNTDSKPNKEGEIDGRHLAIKSEDAKRHGYNL